MKKKINKFRRSQNAHVNLMNLASKLKNSRKVHYHSVVFSKQERENRVLSLNERNKIWLPEKKTKSKAKSNTSKLSTSDIFRRNGIKVIPNRYGE